MSKFCTSCGKALDEGAKFCAACGAAVASVASVAPVSAEAEAAAGVILPQSDVPAVAATEKTETEAEERVNNEVKREVQKSVKCEVKNKVKRRVENEVKSKVKSGVKREAEKGARAFAEKIFAEATPAFATAGEATLPLKLTPFTSGLTGENLFAVLKSGWRGLLSSCKRTLGDKKRLKVVIALTIVWFLVNFLAAFRIFPLPVRILSWLTAARGSLIGGSIGKGLVAALFAQMIADKGMLQSLKGGIGQLTAAAKGGKKASAPLLLGAGVALIVCNLIVSSNLQNTMVCVAGFTLAAKALTRNGFLRRLTAALLPKADDMSVTAVMGGWMLGFALFAAVSLLSGGSNGYILGVLLVFIGGGLMIAGRNNKEVAAQ
ncbi:MAG: zinc ribbon domain-containing protein [Clostridia bacterium]|nr:zinc ribbon domain-containing protein [Clostridia bacterium]